MIKGKSIVAVGRASYMLKGSNSWRGRYIEGHDLVARANNVYPYGSNITPQSEHFIDPKLQKFLGSRTNLLFASSAVIRDDINQNMLNLFVQDGGIAICSAEHSRTRGACKHLVPLIRNVSSFYEVDEKRRSEMLSEYNKFSGSKTATKDGATLTRGVAPTVGILMLQILLSFEVKSISVVGFTCGFDLPLDINVRTFLENHQFHEVRADLLWLREAREKDSRLRFDDTLERVLVEQKDVLDEFEQRVEI